jgi:glutamyl-tRNA reductase
MAENFKVATVSYKNAPLALREKLVLDQNQTASLYFQLKGKLSITEGFILSTCNRTEIYYKADKIHTQEIVGLLAKEKGINPEEILVFFEEILIEHEVIKYLFELSIGLHSQIVGDLQIINQVKIAYQWAVNSNMAGSFLHKLMHTIFITNKRVVQETGFRDGAASTTFVTLDLIESFSAVLKNPKILVLGLGEVGSDIAKSLKDANYSYVSLCNRTQQTAIDLGKKLNYDSIDFDNLHSKLSNFNVIISAIQANEYIITDIKDLNKNSLTYIFDLSVPRSISPLLDKSNGVVLYSLDEIQIRKDKGLKAREAALPAVKEIIDQSLAELQLDLRELSVTPTIQKLKSLLDQIRTEELARYSKNITDKEKELIEKVTNSVIQKILKQPVIHLKDVSMKGDPQNIIHSLNKLFDLE